MDMPPSRYKVVERGRRLIVIDRRSGAPVSGLLPEQKARFDELARRVQLPEPQHRPSASRRPSPVSAMPGEPSVFTTHRWYDDKAPRRVRMGDKSRSGLAALLAVTGIVGVFSLIWLGWFVLPIAAVLLFQPGVRKSIRKAVTVWLDGLEQA